MLPKLISFDKQEVTLIMRSGIQFMDFGLKLSAGLAAGEFVRRETNCSLLRLEIDEATGNTVLPGTRTPSNGADDIKIEQSLALLDDIWVPVPFLHAENKVFLDGPTNWARARLVALKPGEDIDGYTHRLVFAFDTNLADSDDTDPYLAPTAADIGKGAGFELAWRSDQMGLFAEQPWVDGWLAELYRELAPSRLKLQDDDIEDNVRRFLHHQAHWLNLLWVMGNLTPAETGEAKVRPRVPTIKILSNTPTDIHKAVQVDLVLDVGNSRTCGILIEEHPQDSNGLNSRYELELRDLSHPVHVYNEPFESRIEFAEAVFGKVNQSSLTLRTAFLWPTIARIGPEATRLAARRRGTEGTTGLSSPKRYLWDTDPYEAGWRFSESFCKAETENPATAEPFSLLVNQLGEPLFDQPEDGLPVFFPHYSRSSLMTFMLAEVLVQALCQINSPGQRNRSKHANTPRHLRSIILTVPPSMPMPERDIFENRLRQAIGLVWKALGWHPADDPLDEQSAKQAWPPLPSYKMQWDEATCAQVVFLYSEIMNHFGGRADDFFNAIRRKRPGRERKPVTVASIDIGGGTTDLVVSEYSLDDGRGGNVYILPKQRFRDGFKIAGDDIVLEVIRAMVVPAIERAMREAGLHDPAPLLSNLMGAEADIVQNMVLRQKLALQVLHPLALEILRRYEQYDPAHGDAAQALTIGEVLEGHEPPAGEVLDFVATGFRRALRRSDAEFDLLSVRLPVDLNRLHQLFLTDKMEICKTIRSLCEIVYLYDCDVLLISGRPSQLPGVQALFRALLALPPDRIVPLHDFRTGIWYPFHRQGRIGDPKTTAAVGAMLCELGKSRIPNFFFQSNVFRLYSTVRHLGMLDSTMTIKDDDVYYTDIDLDNREYKLPEDVTFEMRGRLILGFRQLAAERWGAAPLYVLDTTAREILYPDGETEPQALVVKLRRVLNDPNLAPAPGQGRASKFKGECLEVHKVGTTRGKTLDRSAVTLKLCTMTNIGIGETSYWLDTGSVLR